MEDQNTPARRLVRTIGLFSPTHWWGFRPHGSAGLWLYDRLKAVGFRNTIWQFVYSGQLGGLILPLDRGLREIHIRFYHEGIEAELEVGRSYFDHFLAPRVDATDIVLGLLESQLTSDELPRARASFHQSRRQGCLDISRAKCPRYTLLAISAGMMAVVLFSIGFVPVWALIATLAAALFVCYTLQIRRPSRREGDISDFALAPPSGGGFSNDTEPVR